MPRLTCFIGSHTLPGNSRRDNPFLASERETARCERLEGASFQKRAALHRPLGFVSYFQHLASYYAFRKLFLSRRRGRQHFLLGFPFVLRLHFPRKFYGGNASHRDAEPGERRHFSNRRRLPLWLRFEGDYLLRR